MVFLLMFLVLTMLLSFFYFCFSIICETSFEILIVI